MTKKINALCIKQTININIYIVYIYSFLKIPIFTNQSGKYKLLFKCESFFKQKNYF